MKTFKGKDYEKERANLLSILSELRTSRDDCTENIASLTIKLEASLSVLQEHRAQINVDVGDVDTIERNILKTTADIENIKKTIEISDTKISKAKKVISGAEVALDQNEYKNFFKEVNAFKSQITNWNINKVDRALEILTESDLLTKTKPGLGKSLIGNIIMRLANVAKK